MLCSATPSMNEKYDAIPTTTVAAFSMNNSHSRSRRTRLLKNDSHVGSSGFASSVDGGSLYDGHDDDDIPDGSDNNGKDMKNVPRLPTWLLESTPDEFVETMRKSESPLHVKYLQTMVECLCMLGKVAAAGAMICQRLRPSIHEIITSKIKAQAEYINSSRPGVGHSRTGTTGLQYVKGQLQSYQLSKDKHKNGTSLAGTLLSVSPVSPVMAPMGAAHAPYLWVHFPGRSSWEVFNEILEKTNVVTILGIGFGPAGEGFIRISAFGHRANVLEAYRRFKELYQ